LFAFPYSVFAAPPAPVPQSGQALCYDSAGIVILCAGTGQDGDIQSGLPWPSPRFVDNSIGSTNQTVTDNLTGLIWAKNANLMTTRDSTFDTDETS
jgi:hypothetical protein